MRCGIAALIGLGIANAALFEGLIDDFGPGMDLTPVMAHDRHRVMFLELTDAVVERTRIMSKQIGAGKANSTVDANSHVGANANATTSVNTKSTSAVETNTSVVVAVNASGALSQGANATAGEAQKQKINPKPWFAVTLSIAFVVKSLCMLSNVVFQFSPFPTVQKFGEKGDTGKMDGAPYMSVMYGGCQWCFYGYYAYSVTQKSGFLVLVYSNIGGAILGTYYVSYFMKHCQAEDIFRRVMMYLRIAAVLVLVQAAAMAVLPCQKSLFFCGFISSLCSSVGAFSQLATVPEVLESRCSSTIDVNMVLIGYISTLLWLVCGILLKDAWICLPQVASLTSFSVALYLVYRFPSDPALAAIQGAREAMESGDGANERQSNWRRAITNAFNAASATGANVDAGLLRTTSTRSYGTCDGDSGDKVYSGDTGGTD